MLTQDTTEFIAGSLINELMERGYQTIVEQTGGGTASVYAWRGTSDEKIIAGPGSFNYKDSAASLFTTDEFYIGEDSFTRNGEEKDYEPSFVSAEEAADVKAIADLIEAEYKKLNG